MRETIQELIRPSQILKRRYLNNFVEYFNERVKDKPVSTYSPERRRSGQSESIDCPDLMSGYESRLPLDRP